MKRVCLSIGKVLTAAKRRIANPPQVNNLPHIVLLLVLACSAQAQDAASLYRQGVDRQQAGDLAGAAELYRQSLKLDGANIAARSNLGAALAGLGRYDEAIPEYQQALKAAPEPARPYLQRNLALAYYKSGRLQEAAPLLLALHESQPANRDASLLAADCLLQLGEPAQALALLEPIAADAANDKALAYVLGIAYLKNGKTADAQRVLDPILKDTASPEGNYALGMAMFTSGDYPSAIKALERAIQLNPTLPHLYSYYGQALIFTGDPEAALAAFEKQLAADRNDYDANYQAGLILSRRSKYTEAEPLLRHAVLLRPGSNWAHLALAEAWIGQNQWSEARKELESAVAKWPEFGEAHAHLAAVYAKAGLKTQESRERGLAAKYTLKTEGITAAGPKPGTPAPRLKLGSVNLPSPEPGKPSVLVFGSYTCPNFRKAAPVLNEFSARFAGQAAFLLVYIREAHATGEWQSTVNEREHVQLAPATSMEQKHDYATMCTRKLELRFPSAVDGLDNAAEQAYAAWPSRVYVISADGQVRYSSGLIEEEFDRAALEAAIRGVIPKRAPKAHAMLEHLETVKQISIGEKIQFWRDVMQYAHDRESMSTSSPGTPSSSPASSGAISISNGFPRRAFTTPASFTTSATSSTAKACRGAGVMNIATYVKGTAKDGITPLQVAEQLHADAAVATAQYKPQLLTRVGFVDLNAIAASVAHDVELAR